MELPGLTDQQNACGCVFFRALPKMVGFSCWLPFNPTYKGVPFKKGTPSWCWLAFFTLVSLWLAMRVQDLEEVLRRNLGAVAAEASVREMATCPRHTQTAAAALQVARVTMLTCIRNCQGLPNPLRTAQKKKEKPPTPPQKNKKRGVAWQRGRPHAVRRHRSPRQ